MPTALVCQTHVKQGTSVLETVTTTGAGWVDFASLLGPGTCTIEETPKPGWSSDGGYGMCSFTLVFPRDAGAVRGYTFTNTKLPRIIVRKITAGSSGGPFTFTTTGDNGLPSPFALTTVAPGVAVEQSFEIGYAGIGGDYSVTEGVTAGFVLTDVSCVVSVAGVAGTTAGSDLPLRTGSITNITAGTTVTCTFINNGAQTTRTQGFWATHLSLVQQVWSSSPHTVGGITTDGMTAEEMRLCADPQVGPLSVEQVMGGFWSNIASTSTGVKRSQLDQARMQPLQQVLAATLNNQLFGSVPNGMTIDQAKAAYCGTNIKAIRNAQSAMASFNASGDSGLVTPGASAMPRESRAVADCGFWDALP